MKNDKEQAEIQRIERPSDHIGALFLEAIQELQKNFKGAAATDKTARALQIVSIYGRFRATEVHENHLKFSAIKTLIEDKKQMREYVKVFMPEINPAKLIEKK